MQLATNGDESPRVLRLASQFLLDLAQIAEAELRNGGPLMPAEPGPTVDEVLPHNPAVYEAARVAARVVGAVPELAAPFEPDLLLDPAVVFGKGDGLPNIPETSGNPTAPVIPPPPPIIQPAENVEIATAMMRAAGTNLSGPLAASGQVDKAGLPHDPRIHSATPTLRADGYWRARRGLDNATLVAVEAELRARGVPAGTAPVSLPPVIPPPPPVVVVGQNAPAAPVIPPPPANPFGFRALMNKIDGHTGAAGKLSAEVMKPIHAEFGATGWPDYVHARLDQIPNLMARIDGLLK